MKNSLIPSFALLTILFSCSSGHNDLEKFGIKGKVKSVKELQYEATYENDRWVAGKRSPFGGRITDYDKNGLSINNYTINSAGDTTGVLTTKRENGDIVEEIYRSYYDSNTSRTLMERVSKEQVNFEVWQNDQLVYEGANYFDGKGRIIRQVQVGGDREVNVYFVYEKNLLVENYREEISGERTATQLYDYDVFDDKGNWTVRLIYVGDEKIAPEMVVKREITYY